MIVHSFDRFGETADFNPVNGALSPKVSNAGGESDSHHVVAGHYGFLAGKLVVLYRLLDVLTLRIGEAVAALDSSTSVLHTQQDAVHTLQVSSQSDGTLLVQINYPPPETIVPIKDDPTPFAESEDFDFGLFVANVANNPIRRATIYRAETDDNTTDA